jgi:hypothetical protein
MKSLVLLAFISSNILFSGVNTFADASKTSITVNQDDPLTDLAFEVATTVCTSQVLEGFKSSTYADGQFSLTMSSKSFPTGLRFVTFKFVSKGKTLVVQKPYTTLNATVPTPEPNCVLSYNGISG